MSDGQKAALAAMGHTLMVELENMYAVFAEMR